MKHKKLNQLQPLLLLILFTLNLSSCEFGEMANQKFGDQHFKTAIALIELHKVRTGKYPETLKNLQFIGEWDNIIFSSVSYKKLEEGYSLDLIGGWIGKPEKLAYPDDFWKGLGLKKSNLKQK